MIENRIEKLDTILGFMADHFDQAVLGRPDDITTKARLAIGYSESYFLLYTLYSDEYVGTHPPEQPSEFYHITPYGMAFISNGGYTAQQAEKERIRVLTETHIQSSINTNTSVKDTNTIQRYSLIATIIIIFIGCVVQIKSWSISADQLTLQKEQMRRDSLWRNTDSISIHGLSEKGNAIQKQLDDMRKAKKP